MFRPTGPGKVHAQFIGPSFLSALLYNFDFDDWADMKYRDLKNEHTGFLMKSVVPMLTNDSGAIWMQGSASKIGTAQWNKTLSQSRVIRVATFLSKNGITPEQMQLDAVGEELAANHSEDDERDRSVRIWVVPKFKFEPTPLPRRVPPKPKTSTRFKIAMIGEMAVTKSIKVIASLKKWLLSRGVLADGIFFIIWDTTNNIACYYFYFGLGLGFGVSGPPVSATTRGPWNPFETEKPVACWQFGRWARFTSAGGGSKSINWITFETPRGVNNVYMRINTGFTFGAGLSTTIGDLIRVSQPFLFRGP